MTDLLINRQCGAAIQRLAAGDMDALTVIYDKLGRRIFMLALSILRNKEAAEDVMQDTFLKIATEAHTYREKSNAIGFVLTVTRNLSLNLLAKRRCDAKNQSSLDEGDEVADATDHFSPTSIGALAALSLLDDDERQIVVMKLDAGMKHRDIAALMGIGEAACQKRYRRALEKLKTYYKQEGKK